MECELTQDTEDGSELDMSTEMNALWKHFRSLDVIGKRVLKSKVRELAFPSTSSICPPPEKVKTKGRVKKSKGMKPDGYDPYIDDIFDVAADGNCGFRAIALLLGFGEECWSLVRKRLDQEIVSHVTPYDRLFTGRIKEVRDSLMISGLGVQPMDKWLSIPDMGYVIATAYNIILVTFGLTFSMTFFPMRGSHSGSTKNDCICCIGFVNGNHWVPLRMKDGFPMPDIAPGWKQYRTNEATSWAIAYTGRLQHWGYLLGRLSRVTQNPPRETVDAMSLDEP
ncbi:uncharacterized protein [Cicer arietinum]|uniref:Uncharacterized protein LOC101514352 n=1 Tax=Cicer arietinum TaxID=3827 RepID=A0A1S2Z7I8_CICAR|nr:uncharacterized protein LOC101514352 [Cicer arietinum]